MCLNLNTLRYFKCLNISNVLVSRCIHNINPELNIEYLCNPLNTVTISENIERRKGIGNIQHVMKLHEKLQQLQETTTEHNSVKQQFILEALKIPNESHKDVIAYGNDPKVLKHIGYKNEFNFKPKEFHEITRNLNLMRTNQLGNVAGTRSYYFYGALAELEQVLIRFTIKKLLKNGFKLLSVPDILPANIIESCGMSTKGKRTQVYSLDNDSNMCLSIKIAAVSRCYRAETSSVAEERGIYRVHQFTKVEMFAVTHPDESDSTLESFREFEEDHFSSLGIHLQTLDMPPHELGAPAYRKYDVEAWLPGRNTFGEVSSCSNCTDFQARRLRIKYNADGELKHVHTVNGTALAVPRILIALLETYQNEDGTVNIPDVLKPYLKFDQLCKEKLVPELKLKKIKR